MEEDNQTTATQLHKMLAEKGYNLSLNKMLFPTRLDLL